jgi:hypothetical protein
MGAFNENIQNSAHFLVRVISWRCRYKILVILILLSRGKLGHKEEEGQMLQ